MTGRALTQDQADKVWSLLVAHAGAAEHGREEFVQVQVDGCAEYRFQGSLGFGGKFRVDRDRWYVTAYPEDILAVPERQATITDVNMRLGAMLTLVLATEAALAADV